MTNLELAQKVITAYGGQKKLEAIEDITTKFEFKFFQRDGTTLTGEGTEHFKKPNKNYFEFVFPDLIMLNACDGEQAWQTEGNGEPAPIDTERFMIHTRLRTFPLSLVEDPPQWSYKGEVDLDDLEKAHWIQVIYSEKEKVSYYLDPKTFLLHRYQGPSRAMGMKVTAVVLFDDYASIDGVMFPKHLTFLINVNKFQERWIKEIKLNTSIPDTKFQLQS